MQELPFTGERFTPECVREIWYEHVHRYALARHLAAGKRVLDVACGEGYGSAMLAPVAKSVLGVDLSGEAIRHARARYGLLPNLSFDEADATRAQFAGAPFDMVVSFETLEHVEAQDELVGGLAAALEPGGFALLSSPDKAEYSDATGHRNEFHVRELYRDELLALLGRHFRVVRLYGQRLMFHSAIWAIEGGRGGTLNQTLHADGRCEADALPRPMYYFAACAQNERDLPALPGLALFADAGESVYAHYHHEIRKNMQAGTLLAEREQALLAAQASLAEAERRLRDLESRHAAAPARRRFWPFGRN